MGWDIFQDMQQSASFVLRCSISCLVLQLVVLRCRYNCVIFKPKTYILYSRMWIPLIPLCADSVVVITVACQAMNSGSNPDRRIRVFYIVIIYGKPYRILKQ